MLATPSVRVTFPEALHQCLRDESKPWGCCVGACGAECCEKALGSPRVELKWNDGGDDVVFTFSHTPGASTLVRRGVIYYCLTDAAAVLRRQED